MRYPNNHPSPRRLHVVVCFAAALLLSASAAHGYDIVLDPMNYNSWNGATPQMDDVWMLTSGNAPTLVAEPSPSTSHRLTLINGVVDRTLAVSLDQNFELEVDALHGAYQRILWAGLFNAAGTQGYTFLWDSTASGAGVVSIQRYNVTGPSALTFNNKGTALTTTVSSGHALATSGPLAKLKLTWDKPTSTLRLYVDGVLKHTVVDSSYSTFSRIVIAGNGAVGTPATFDNTRVGISSASTQQLQAESYSATSGATISGTKVTSLNAGDWIRFNNVYLADGYLTFQARVASANAPTDYGQLQLRLDSPTGTQIAALRVLNTGGLSTWETQTSGIISNTGVHDLYVVVAGGNGTSIADLDWIMLRRDIVSRGATVPFVTYEAEDGTKTGTVNGSSDLFYRYGASGRSYVWLDADNEYVQWTAALPANRLTLRYGIPQNTTGTVGVYVNSTLYVVNLASAQCYDAADVTTKPRRYNEVTIPVTVAKNDIVKIQKRSGADTLAWYAIDLVDLEQSPAAASVPAGFISITSYGATANDATDDYSAIMMCITAAGSTGKKVFFPAGTFRTETRINLPADYEVRGAGLNHTTLYCPKLGGNYSDFVGFGVSSNCRISDLTVEGASTERGNGSMGTRSLSSASGFTLENMRFLNTGDVIGWTVYSNATFRNLRVIGTYADGIHLGDSGVQNCLVENCFFRGSGDDAIAQVNSANLLLCSGNVAQFNTIVASYSGRGIANIGGDTFTVRDCVIDGVFNAGLMTATESLPPSISRPIQGFKVQRTTVELCGHPASVYSGGSNHAGVHFWLFATSMRDVKIEDCSIINGETKAIRIDDTDYGDDLGRTQFNYNTASGNVGGGLDDASPEIQPVLTNNSGF